MKNAPTRPRPTPRPRAQAQPVRRRSSETETTPMWDATVQAVGGAPVFEPHGDRSPWRYEWPS